MFGSMRERFPAQIGLESSAHSERRSAGTTPVHHNHNGYECPAPTYQHPDGEVEAAVDDDGNDIELVQECIGSSYAPLITISRISDEFKAHMKASPIFENENWRTMTKTKRNRAKPNVIGVSSKDVEATWAEAERLIALKLKKKDIKLEEKMPAYYYLLNMLLKSKVERIDDELRAYNTTVWTTSVLNDARKYLVFQGSCMIEMVHRYFEFACMRQWKLQQEQIASISQPQGGTNTGGIKNLI